MLRDDAVARIKRRLLYKTGSSIDSDIVDALQDAQQRLEDGEPVLPWFLHTEIETKSTTAGEERVLVPTDFLREDDTDALWWYNATATSPDDKWTALAKDDVDNLREAYPDTGAPKAYALLGNYFRIFPTPDDTYPLKMIFFHRGVLLDSNIENVWLKYAPWWLMGEAGADIAASLGMADAAQRFQQQADAQKVMTINATIARDEAGRSRTVGGPN